jgi:MFS family permease
MAKQRVFYGWVIAASAFLALLVTNGIIISGITAFDASLLQEFGWSRGTLKFRDLVTFLAAGLLGPPSGALADRLGVKPLMLFGAGLLAACVAAYSRVESATGMYVVHLVFAGVLVTCGLIVSVLLTSRWFVARRGTALGFVIVGTSLGGVVFPLVNTALISAYGWRTAMLVLTLPPIGLLVLLALLVRESPAAVGLHPYGYEAAGNAAAQPLHATGMAYRDAVRTPTFWALSIAAMSTFYAILGTQAHLILHLRGLALGDLRAASGLSLLFLMGLLGKFVFGMLADIYDKRRVLLLNLVVMWVGSLALASMSSSAIWPAIVLFGLGWGGIYTLLQVLCMSSFGLKAGGKILGTITVLDAIGGGLGIWMTGLLYDRSDSYALPFSIVAGMVTLALAAGTLVNPRLAERHAPLAGVQPEST